MNITLRKMFSIISSDWVKHITKESIMFSTFVAIGSRHAVLNHEHSFRMWPAPSSPIVPSIGMLRALSATRSAQSGSMLSVRRYSDRKARYTNGAICTTLVILRSTLTSLLAALRWSGLSISECL